MVFSQTAVILTYGALISLVGALQIFFREQRTAWTMGLYTLAGVLLILFFYHLFILFYFGQTETGESETAQPSASKKNTLLEGVSLWRYWIILFLMLLPQGLMFHARVLYLYDTHTKGGLECTMQEIGFAQGTVGVIAFSLGVALGHSLLRHYRHTWVLRLLGAALGISPAVYLFMTHFPPTSLITLSLCTFLAQGFFGLGLSACYHMVSYVNKQHYSRSFNPLHIPIIAVCLVVPMALSGWLTTRLGYQTFFLADTLCAPLSWLAALILLPHKLSARY